MEQKWYANLMWIFAILFFGGIFVAFCSYLYINDVVSSSAAEKGMKILIISGGISILSLQVIAIATWIRFKIVAEQQRAKIIKFLGVMNAKMTKISDGVNPEQK